MDPRLLEYYNRELVYMRELATEFARLHPKIARRLGMQAGEIGDPYVERLIESFCFIAARTEIKIDAEFPRFTERLLEIIYPNYVAPTPSMAVVQVFPGEDKGNMAGGVPLPRGTQFWTGRPDEKKEKEETSCRFVSGQDVTVYPLQIVDARLTGVPPDIPSLGRYAPPDRQVRSALRLRLQTTSATRIADLGNLDRLPVYIAGDLSVASHLFELVHATSVATIIGEPGQFGATGKPLSAVTSNAVVHEGLGSEQGLLPLIWSKFHGHNLLHEYFACPERFYFFTLTDLKPALHRISGRDVEIVILLDRSADRLAPLVDASRFALFCTPIINLFRIHTEQIDVSTQDTEFRLSAARLLPLDYEIFSIARVYGQESRESKEMEFRPLFQSLNNDEGNYGRYFTMRRERRLISDSVRRYGTRTSYVGTEALVSLVDQNEELYAQPIRVLSADAWVTNRDLPLLIPRNGVSDLHASAGDGVKSVGLIRPPSTPRPPFAERELAWKLIRQLNFNYLPFSDMDHREGGQGLRDLLRLFLTDNDTESQRQVQALIGVKTQPVHDMLPGKGPLVFGRGIGCTLTVDETGFSGISPYLMGLILEHYLARHVSMNNFTRTELHSMQRGLVARWPVRMGTRGAA